MLSGRRSRVLHLGIAYSEDTGFLRHVQHDPGGSEGPTAAGEGGRAL